MFFRGWASPCFSPDVNSARKTWSKSRRKRVNLKCDHNRSPWQEPAGRRNRHETPIYFHYRYSNHLSAAVSVQLGNSYRFEEGWEKPSAFGFVGCPESAWCSRLCARKCL